MTEQVKVRITKETVLLLKRLIGKTITRIGFVLKLDFSLSTILESTSFTLKLINTPVVKDCFGEEYPHFSITETTIVDDIAYADEKYEYLDINFTISSIELLTDKTSWDIDGEHGYFDIQNGVILHDDAGRQLIFYAPNTIAEAIAIYTDRDSFEIANKIEDHYPIEEAQNITYERIIEAL